MSARSLNKVMLIGNLTRDPELRYTPNGTAVCSFGLATNRSWKDPNGQIQEDAEFHNIVAWAKMAEICSQILAKGMMVYLEGSLSTRSWQDEAGNTKYKTEVRINDMKLLDSKGKTGVGSSAKVEEESTSGKTAEDLLAELSSDEEIEDSKKKKSKGTKTEEKDEDPLSDVPF